MDREIEFLKNSGNDPINLQALDALRQLGALLDAPVEAPPLFKPVLEAWQQFRIMAISVAATKKYPALTACWKDIHAKFAEYCDDETLLDTWCFFDFPCQDGLSYGEIFLKEEKPSHLTSFVKTMVKSRLGLYQVVLASDNFLRLKELQTERVVEAHNTIDMHDNGEIFLIRLFPLGGKYFMFGSPSGFPSEWKDHLDNMVIDKMLTYYDDDPSNRFSTSYEKHMKLSGPYWMSVVSNDGECEILDPDHYHKYLK